jgi:aminoglycoside phosphotransferase (APT) family kinase protein
VDESSLSANGVVDWDMCTVGDPFYELAILLAYWGEADDKPAYEFQCRMPKEAEGWWSRKKVIEQYFSLTGFEQQDLDFYWWLTQFRNIVVYAQLNALFTHTGEYPAALTQEECEMMAERIDLLLNTISECVGTKDFW